MVFAQFRWLKPLGNQWGLTRSMWQYVHISILDQFYWSECFMVSPPHLHGESVVKVIVLALVVLSSDCGSGGGGGISIKKQ